jgi:hypothetical protein
MRNRVRIHPPVEDIQTGRGSGYTVL